MNKPSKPFSNGTEYMDFMYQFCERCSAYKEREEDGLPESPDKGGCPILDAIENAMFDIKQFPTEWVRELTSADDDSHIAWHYCIRFTSSDWGLMEKYFTLMKNALVKHKTARKEGDKHDI